jgi:hypothetical protein
MSRAGYSDDLDMWALIRWRGAVKSAIRGKRGQLFLREMLCALDALPNKRLIEEELEKDGEVCALGAIGLARGINMSTVDPEDYYAVSEAFSIPHALAQEIMFVNDESLWWKEATPEKRFDTVRKWVASQVSSEAKVEHP